MLHHCLPWLCIHRPLYNILLKEEKINLFERQPQYTMKGGIASICFKSQMSSILKHCQDPQSRKLEGLEKRSVLKASFISTQKELLQSVQTQEYPKIQKARGNPTPHICWLTSCPKLSKIKQNITEKHDISLKTKVK